MGVPLKVEEFREGREPFIGLVVSAKENCECEECRKGYERLKEMGLERRTDRVHIVIAPVDGTYQRNQHTWISGKTKNSTAYLFVEALSKTGFQPKSWEDLEDEMFEWEFLTIRQVKDEVTGWTRDKGIWIPRRHVTGAEKEKYMELYEKRSADL